MVSVVCRAQRNKETGQLATTRTQSIAWALLCHNLKEGWHSWTGHPHLFPVKSRPSSNQRFPQAIQHNQWCSVCTITREALCSKEVDKGTRKGQQTQCCRSSRASWCTEAKGWRGSWWRITRAAAAYHLVAYQHSDGDKRLRQTPQVSCGWLYHQIDIRWAGVHRILSWTGHKNTDRRNCQKHQCWRTRLQA